MLHSKNAKQASQGQDKRRLRFKWFQSSWSFPGIVLVYGSVSVIINNTFFSVGQREGRDGSLSDLSSSEDRRDKRGTEV